MGSRSFCTHRQGYIASAIALKVSSLLFVIGVVLTFWIHPPSPRHIPSGWLIVVQITEIVSVILVTLGFAYSAVVDVLTLNRMLGGVASASRHKVTTCRLESHRISGIGGLLGWIGTVMYVGNITLLSTIVPAFFVAFFSSAAIAVSAVAVEILKDFARTTPYTETASKFPRIQYPAIVKDSLGPLDLSTEDLLVHNCAKKPLLPQT